jgi:hypothetical protein
VTQGSYGKQQTAQSCSVNLLDVHWDGLCKVWGPVCSWNSSPTSWVSRGVCHYGTPHPIARLVKHVAKLA